MLGDRFLGRLTRLVTLFYLMVAGRHVPDVSDVLSWVLTRLQSVCVWWCGFVRSFGLSACLMHMVLLLSAVCVCMCVCLMPAWGCWQQSCNWYACLLAVSDCFVVGMLTLSLCALGRGTSPAGQLDVCLC